MIRLSALLALALTLVATPAVAQSGLTIDQVSQLSNDRISGLKLVRDDDSYSKWWDGEISDREDRKWAFRLVGYDCSTGEIQRCRTFRFVANVPVNASVRSAVLAGMSSYNTQVGYGRSYLINNDETVVFDHAVVVDGEVGPAYLDRRLDDFTMVFGRFVSFLTSEIVRMQAPSK